MTRRLLLAAAAGLLLGGCGGPELGECRATGPVLPVNALTGGTRGWRDLVPCECWDGEDWQPHQCRREVLESQAGR